MLLLIVPRSCFHPAMHQGDVFLLDLRARRTGWPACDALHRSWPPRSGRWSLCPGDARCPDAARRQLTKAARNDAAEHSPACRDCALPPSPGSRMHHHSCRLVDHGQVVILVNDVERNVFRHRPQWRQLTCSEDGDRSPPRRRREALAIASLTSTVVAQSVAAPGRGWFPEDAPPETGPAAYRHPPRPPKSEVESCVARAARRAGPRSRRYFSFAAETKASRGPGRFSPTISATRSGRP